jgi:Fe-S oxidoreductase
MPCYIDLIYPKVGIATLELLERFGLNVKYPQNQTCCGQPMSNSGDPNAAAAERLFVDHSALSPLRRQVNIFRFAKRACQQSSRIATPVV